MRTKAPAVDDADRRVSATEAAKNFGALVHHVRETGAAFTVERGGHAVARIVAVTERTATVADLAEFLRRARTGGDEFGAAVTDAVRASNRARVPRDPWVS